MGFWSEVVRIILRHRLFCLALLISLIAFLLLTVGMGRLGKDPRIHLLVSEGGAEWIRFPETFRLSIRQQERKTTHFRYRLDIPAVPATAVLTLRAMKHSTIYLDGRLLYRSPDDLQKWKEPHYLDLTAWLTQGSHELRVEVLNENGHPALLVYCNALGIRSDDRWEASDDGRRWMPALPVEETPPFAISRSFPRSDQALRDLLPLFTPLFALFFFWSLRSDDRLRPVWVEKTHLSAAAARWLLLGAWVVIAVNNFWKIPLSVGMDYEGHTKYIYYVAYNWRIPVATEGWQMFQPPLFHFLAAAIFRSIDAFFSPGTVVRILKLLPLLCGAAQVELSYRMSRYAYPRRESLQVIGTLIGGLFPMNLYMSQSLGNEPLAGLLTALIILLACRIISGDSLPPTKIPLLMGFLLGLAMLSKTTALLIVPPLLFFVSASLLRKSRVPGEGIRSAVYFVILFLGVAFIVSGWYYLRNYIEIGRFFVGGWDPFRKIVWWQDPGYRTPLQCFIFGEALFYPVFSSIYGFWDAIYSSLWMDGFLSANYDTPWNFPFMLSGAWLSLLPTAAIFIGAVAALRNKDGPFRQMLRFSVSGVIVYLIAIFYLFLTVPILSSAKATYALGLTPCFALLASAGFEVLTRWRFLRAAVYGLIACWAVAAYAAYFVI
ncbi:MAG: hypothetical protein A2V87_02150 [Deltaproteobacteria bacterium RBG_16_58_17]|nr:MAG: hypothetical protein A2V87_02150 [Deltaproteobacteria bacterium RBG_16_58_17]OHE18079.1 MAG: hypothetical protein A2X96_03825 [Syntrophobacterales bacterium GWC2_56_13]